MTQVKTKNPEEELKKEKKTSKFDNVFFDMLYNVITWLPVTIISWIASNLDF